MNSRQLDTILRTDPFTRGHFWGVYPSDLLPKQGVRYPCSLIANVDSHYLPGSHWVAFYFTIDGKGEFMDSYGNAPGFYCDDFEQFMRETFLERWTCNNVSLQGEHSNVCGESAISFLLHRSRGVALEKIIGMFSKSTAHNDRMVWKFCKKRFPRIFGQNRMNDNRKPLVQSARKRLLAGH